MKKTMSSYIVRSLEKGETIVLWGHYHWTFTASQVVWSYIGAPDKPCGVLCRC